MKTNLPQPLVDSLQKDQVVLFIGAGMSIQASLPTWKKLVIDILSEKKAYIDKASGYIQAVCDDIITPLEALDKIEGYRKDVYSFLENSSLSKYLSA